MKRKRFVRVRIGKTSMRAEVANTLLSRSKGLMFRKRLNKGECMLFDFGKDSFPKMWMMGMLFPLDFIWINSKMKIVDIHQNASHREIWKTYGSKSSARYVIEVKDGFCKENNIKIGQNVRII